jgi:hypothetical protein
MNQRLKNLRIQAMKERATIYHTCKLSNSDSSEIAKVIYMTAGSRDVLPYHKPQIPYYKQMSFRDFCQKVKDGLIPENGDGFMFRGMAIEWFTGDTTSFVLKDPVIETIGSEEFERTEREEFLDEFRAVADRTEFKAPLKKFYLHGEDAEETLEELEKLADEDTA